ncbi:TetR/AcrR family transcriptional regulator [Microbispora sp. RL4-1S]|uniref:TetR/AcrR family transcriptional regulator n=1 Tax=Microbispora oryzae TaxID=2806554 RepID=A0A940WRZ3_9ACTN|nr:TetR/AcrR family transcriptional regulator [Microbispora oryzae]MBP2705966.1 TetR/AcrR family transcriptional regulator [Microbispora oryzae]
MGDTRTRLLEGALETLRTQGIAGASARAIAGSAGVNQALVFYHFGTVDDLLAAALQYGSEQRVTVYRARFSAVTSLKELLDLGRSLHAEEREAGNLAVLAQMLAGSQMEGKLAPATAAGFGMWVTEVEGVLQRVLAGTPLAEFVDVAGLARATAAAFVGLELYDGVDRDGAQRAFDSLEQLAGLVTVLDDMGPLVRRTVRSRLRRANSG